MRNTYFEYIIKFRVSYGTFIALKPFYVRSATTHVDSKPCCSKHFYTLIHHAKKQNIVIKSIFDF